MRLITKPTNPKKTKKPVPYCTRRQKAQTRLIAMAYIITSAATIREAKGIEIERPGVLCYTPVCMRIKDTEHFDREGFSGDVYMVDKEPTDFGALRVTAHGHHKRKKVTDGIRVYFVIDGHGTFTIDDTTYDVYKDDLYVIKPGSEYEYEGTMNLFEINIPHNQ